MEILLKDGVVYSLHNWETENEFERIALAQFKSIFGDKAILFDKQKIKTETGIGTIPDAFIISPETQKWFIIEVELASHNVYQHIIPQITKFKNALNLQTRKTLTKFFDNAITNDLHKYATWVSATNNKSAYKQLTEIIDGEPELLIIIDDRNLELEIASNNLPFKTSINIFKTFCRKGFGLGDNIYQFNTTIEKLIKPKIAAISKSYSEKGKELALEKGSNKKGRGGSDTLLEQIIPVIKSIQKNGMKYYTTACKEIAAKIGNGIHHNSVMSQCTRGLGFNGHGSKEMFL